MSAERSRGGRRSLGTRIVILLAQRVGAALGLGIAIAFLRGFWDAALEGFLEGIAEGLGGSVLALVVTGLALVLVYATLGAQVDAISVRLIALVAGKGRGDRTAPAENTAAGVADLLATPVYLGASILLVLAGMRDSHATWTMLGFAAFALAGLSAVSTFTHLWFLFRLRKRKAPGREDVLDDDRVEKGGEIAGVFVSLAVLSLTLCASVFSALPGYRYGEAGWPLAFGDYARLCIGEAGGCRPRQVWTFLPEAGRKTLVEVASSEAARLQSSGRDVAVDANGRPVTLKQSGDSSYAWEAAFLPAPGVTYQIVADKTGHYSVRYRNAP
jgi:hypothetical protein